MSDEELGAELVEVTGYPADKGVVYMWTMFHELKKSMTSETLDYEIDTYQGQSGGAVWIRHGDDNVPYVIGVHTRGKTAKNRGVRISPIKFTWLIKILSETAELPQSALAVLPISANQEPFRPEEEAAHLSASQQNDEQMFKLFEGSAEKGDKRAQRCLANLYRKGQGVSRSLGRAIYWYKKAADQKDPVSQKMLGDFYKHGRGVEKSDKIAVSLYRESVDGGNEYAAKALGDCFSLGQGVDPNAAEAVAWYQKAADKNLASAQERLAYCYHDGKGVPQSYEQAAQWFQKAVDQDRPIAQKMLGDLYRDGHGVVKNYETAADLYLKSANRGNAYAQKALGDLYRTGHGVLQSNELAAQWYQKAINNKNFAEESRCKTQETLEAIKLHV